MTNIQRKREPILERKKKEKQKWLNTPKWLATYLITILSLSYSTNLHAIPHLGLHQVIDSAIANYPSLKSRQLLQRSAEFAIRDANNQSLPSLRVMYQANYGTDNSLSGSYFPLSIIPSTSGGIRSSSLGTAASGSIAIAYSEYEVATFGLNSARESNAVALEQVASADVERTKYWVEYHVTQLYFELLRYHFLSDIQQENIQRYQNLRRSILSYTSSGVRPGVDSSIANAEISRSRISLLKMQTELKHVQTELRYYAGLSDDSFEIDTSTSEFQPSTLRKIQTLVVSDSISASLPILQYYTARWNSAKAQQEYVEAGYRPKISLLGAAWLRGSSIGMGDSFGGAMSGLSPERYNYLLAVNLSYNLSDIIHGSDKSDVQAQISQAVHEELVDQQQLLHQQLSQADQAIQASLAQLDEIPTLLKASEEVYSQKLAQYNAGLSTIDELTNATYYLNVARENEIETKYELLDRLLQKAVENNSLIEFLQTL